MPYLSFTFLLGDEASHICFPLGSEEEASNDQINDCHREGTFVATSVRGFLLPSVCYSACSQRCTHHALCVDLGDT